MSLQTCSHCGLRFRGRDNPPETEPVFCCAGCEAVYYALHDSGLDEFYDRRESWSVDEPRPVEQPGVNDDEVSLFDSPAFLNEQATRLDDGTMKVQLHLEGVHCAGCIWLVERMPRLVDGVIEARLELTRARITIRWNPQRILLSEIATWLGQFGFTPHPIRSHSVKSRSKAGRRMLMRVGICWAVAVNVMLLTIAHYAGLDAAADSGLYYTVLYTTFALSVVSLVVGATVFFRRAIANLKMGKLSMDVPISLGIAVGWGHSTWATFTGSGEVWFDSIVILTAALLTARYLQIRGNSMAADAADRLVSLLPQTARRIVEDTGEIQTVPADTLEVGDRIRVLAGDVLPADGRVIDGSGQVSRAVLTGESDTTPVGVDDVVEAGTRNVAGPLVVQVTATGDATRVGRLMEWVDSEIADRAPVVQLADRLSGVFVAVVLAAAVATAVAWGFIDSSRAVANVVALLVIACPCALGMATPLALTVGAGQAASRGIHVKRDDVMESLNGVTDVIFDKTGTLTYGRPDVVEVFGNTEAATLGCQLERHSNHPLASALLRWSRDHGVAPTPQHSSAIDDVEEVAGAGIRGIVDGREIAVGRLSWFCDVPDSLRQDARRTTARGFTPVGVAVDGTVQAVIAVGDELREETPRILNELRSRGVRIHLVSGDHPQVVATVAEQLHIDPEYVFGGATPEQKLEYVEQLRNDTDAKTVAMVGDGVNDAAALQAADIGIAVHGGTEASLASADVFMGKQGVEPVAELLAGCRRTMHVVRRNLAGSGLYNLFGISLAAMGYITPLLAAILMPVSSLAVVGSSLIQNSFRSEAPAATDSISTTEVTA